MWVPGVEFQQTPLKLAGFVIEMLRELASVGEVPLGGCGRRRMIVWRLVCALVALPVASLGAVCELCLLHLWSVVNILGGYVLASLLILVIQLRGHAGKISRGRDLRMTGWTYISHSIFCV